MSFPRYPKYKDSGVDWLGEVPEHWSVLPLKRIVANPITDGPHETPQFVGDGVPFVSAEAVSSGRIDFSKIRACISLEDNARYSQKYSPKLHDIYMVKSGATTGITAIVEDRTDFNIWSPLAAIRCGEKAVPHFVLNFMRSRNFLEAITLNWSFGTQQNIGMGVIENLRCTIPPKREQFEIAAFLIQETAKIDALVAEQRRLMELLKEKRQAVISHAVTKGLNPAAPMKPSGSEWLGNVPAHWRIAKLSQLTNRIGDGLHGTPEYVDESEFRFVNGNNLNDGRVVFTDTTRCVSEIEYNRHRVGLDETTLLLSINGTVGNLALFQGEMIMLGKSAAYVNCNEFLRRDHLYWYLQSTPIRCYFDLAVTGTTISNLSLEAIRQLTVALPPSEEQSLIVAYLQAQAGRYGELVAESQRAIDLLQERRTALISAAVTGQIDVRGLVQSEAA